VVRKTAGAKKRPRQKLVRKASEAKKQRLKKPIRNLAGAKKQLPKKPLRRTTGPEKTNQRKAALRKVATKRRRRVPQAVSQPEKMSSSPRRGAKDSHRLGIRLPQLDRVRRILQDPAPLATDTPAPSADRLFAEPDEAPQTASAADSEVSTSQDAVTAVPEAGPAPAQSGDSQPADDSYESLRLRWEREPPETKG
jgi:hypothetical protein